MHNFLLLVKGYSVPEKVRSLDEIRITYSCGVIMRIFSGGFTVALK